MASDVSNLTVTWRWERDQEGQWKNWQGWGQKPGQEQQGYMSMLRNTGRAPITTYLGLEIVRVVVGVLRVHWLLLQTLAHVAGILSTEAGNVDTGRELPSSGQWDRGSRSGIWFLILPSAPLCSSVVVQGKRQVQVVFEKICLWWESSWASPEPLFFFFFGWMLNQSLATGATERFPQVRESRAACPSVAGMRRWCVKRVR